MSERGCEHRDLTLFPAIDLRRGRCVRLEQGAGERETTHDNAPVRVAETLDRKGAAWIHVVDLDAAFGEGSNRALIAELARRVTACVQTGGGVRGESDLEEVLGSAVHRAVIGSAAVERPELVRWAVDRWGADRIAIGLDARGRHPAVRGWREESGRDLFSLAAELMDHGARTFIYTDIERDGMFAGPNVALAAELAERTGAEVIVSGGVAGVRDIEAVVEAARAEPRIVGAIVTKPLYEKRLDAGEAPQRMRA